MKTITLINQIQKFSLYLISFIILSNYLVFAGIPAEHEKINRNFKALMQQYQNINNIYVKSRMVIKSYPDRAQDSPTNEITILLNNYEYWANADGFYRVKSTFLEPNGIPENDWEFSYNGVFFQLFDKNSSLLSYSKDASEIMPWAPENPFFAPLLFLGRNDENCQACTLQLEELRDNKRWKNKIENIKTVRILDKQPTQIVMESPGSIMDEREFHFRISWNETANMPSQIDWVDSEENIIQTVEVNSCKSIDANGKKTYWPKTVRIFNKDKQGNLLAELNAEIEVCEINKELPPNIFTIDFSSASAIWDEDAERFVK